jgi:hypothetical protein
MSRIFSIIIIALFLGELLYKLYPILMINRAVLVWVADHVRLRYVRLVIFVQIFLRLKVWVPLSESRDRMDGSVHLHRLIIVPIVSSYKVILEDLTAPLWVSLIIMILLLVFVMKLIEDVKLQILPVGFLTMLIPMVRYLRKALSLSDLMCIKFVTLL